MNEQKNCGVRVKFSLKMYVQPNFEGICTGISVSLVGYFDNQK